MTHTNYLELKRTTKSLAKENVIIWQFLNCNTLFGNRYGEVNRAGCVIARSVRRLGAFARAFEVDLDKAGSFLRHMPREVTHQFRPGGVAQVTGHGIGVLAKVKCREFQANALVRELAARAAWHSFAGV